MVVRVLIVDDSAVIRSFLNDVLSSDDGVEVVGMAGDAAEAREKIVELTPDLVTLDVEMPGMDGIAFLQRLMRLRPLPVIMVSSLTQIGAEATFKALEAGAVDFAAKPLSNDPDVWVQFAEDLVIKVKAGVQAVLPQPDVRVALPQVGVFRGDFRLVAVGGSTGSVGVIQNLLQALPPSAPPIAIVVHMPGRFTSLFAQRLNNLTALQVREAVDGDVLHSGTAIIAPGGFQFRIEQNGANLVCRVAEDTRVNGHVPSVDVFFESVAQTVGADASGLILSGMGHDGALGLKAMRQAGAVTAAQDEESCLIPGMPRTALRLDAVLRCIEPAEMAAFVMGNGWVKAHRPQGGAA